MLAKLLAVDERAVLMDGEAAEPFGADIFVALLERQVLRRPRVEVREVEEEAHVERLPYRPQLLHERVIEAHEMLVLEGLHDRVGEHDGARFDRVAREFAAL